LKEYLQRKSGRLRRGTIDLGNTCSRFIQCRGKRQFYKLTWRRRRRVTTKIYTGTSVNYGMGGRTVASVFRIWPGMDIMMHFVVPLDPRVRAGSSFAIFLDVVKKGLFSISTLKLRWLDN
jgi:hypothetical protein